MSNFSKKIIPRKASAKFWETVTNIWISRYKRKFKGLVIRPETSDHSVFRSIFLFNEFKLPIHIEPKFIVDAGAYTGLSALYYTNKYPSAQIVTIEPETSNYELLLNNTKGFPNVSSINAGLWSSNGFLKITNKSHEKWAFIVEEVDESEDYDVRSVTIDSILADSNFDIIDILKIDIEGSEKKIFENSATWINHVNVIVVELHDRFQAGCSEALFGAINKNDWNQYREGEKVILIRKKLLKHK